MAFFKFRKGGDRQQTSASVHPESVEAMRRRAKHRLIGAAVLVIAGVVGFPLVFDTQPRPIAVDVPIVIPDKNSVKPLTMPAAAPAVASATSSTVAPAVPAASDKVPATAALSPKEEIVSSPPKSPAATAAVTPPAAPKPATVAAASKPVPPAAPAPAKTSDGAKALALLEGKAPEASSVSATASASDSGRFVVQVGAFADAEKAREARMKVERSGMKTYTQVADTKDGKRTRVRVGPFASRAEADKAAAKIKGLDLSAAVLTL